MTPTTHHPSLRRFHPAASLILLLTFFLALPLSRGHGADEKPDFEIRTFSIKIYRYSPATAAELDKHTAKPIRVEVHMECTMEDFTKVCDHAWIEKLKFYGSAPLIESFEPIAKLSALVELDATGLDQSHDAPFDVTPLAGLSELKVLRIYGTEIKNTTALGKLTKLTAVDLHMCDVDNIDFLRNNPGVEKLELYGPGQTFENYQPLLSLPQLEYLGIYRNPAATDENLAILADLTALESVSMSNCKQVSTLSFLSGSAKSIKILAIHECSGLTDLSILAELTAMENFGARELPTEDLGFLSKMPNLKVLNLQKVKVSDLSVFAGLSKLKTVHLTRDMLPEGAEEQLKAMLPEAKFYIR